MSNFFPKFVPIENMIIMVFVLRRYGEYNFYTRVVSVCDNKLSYIVNLNYLFTLSKGPQYN